MYEAPPDPVTVAGIEFPNRIGLAAGFDKNAEVLPFLQALGFGFVEVGTVVPVRQEGSPRPRLFRLPKDQALCNRMGFNSDGVLAVSARLRAFRDMKYIPVGGSLGKQKETPLHEAAGDYVAVMNYMRSVDYYVADVSSPNTPDLRQLQERGYLEALIQRLVEYDRILAQEEGQLPKPVFLKIDPDLSQEKTAEAVDAAERGGAAGFILGNTTLVPPPHFDRARHPEVHGGFSGPYTFQHTLDRVRFIRKLTRRPIIACGGISKAEQVSQVCEAGADLVQIFTGLVYQGPAIIRKLAQGCRS